MNRIVKLFLLDSEQATEPASGIIRFGAVVIRENRVVATITKKCAAEFSDTRRRFHPARSFRIDIFTLLQLSILLFGQNLNAHRSCQIKRVAVWFNILHGVQRYAVVAKPSAVCRTLR